MSTYGYIIHAQCIIMHLCHSCLTPLCPAQSASTSPLPEPVGQTRAAPPRNSVAVFHPIDSPLYIFCHFQIHQQNLPVFYQCFWCCLCLLKDSSVDDVLDTAKLVSSNVRRMEPSNQFFVSKLVAFAYSYVIRCACLANLQLDRSRCSRLPSPDLGLWTPTHQWWSCDMFFCCSWGRWRDNAWLQTLQPCVEIHVIYILYYNCNIFLICMIQQEVHDHILTKFQKGGYEVSLSKMLNKSSPGVTLRKHVSFLPPLLWRSTEALFGLSSLSLLEKLSLLIWDKGCSKIPAAQLRPKGEGAYSLNAVLTGPTFQTFFPTVPLSCDFPTWITKWHTCNICACYAC